MTLKVTLDQELERDSLVTLSYVKKTKVKRKYGNKTFFIFLAILQDLHFWENMSI